MIIELRKFFTNYGPNKYRSYNWVHPNKQPLRRSLSFNKRSILLSFDPSAFSHCENVKSIFLMNWEGARTALKFQICYKFRIREDCASKTYAINLMSPMNFPIHMLMAPILESQQLACDSLLLSSPLLKIWIPLDLGAQWWSSPCISLLSFFATWTYLSSVSSNKKLHLGDRGSSNDQFG